MRGSGGRRARRLVVAGALVVAGVLVAVPAGVRKAAGVAGADGAAMVAGADGAAGADGVAGPGGGAPRVPADGPPADAMTLPAPTGRYRVGTVALHLTHRSRTDPWAGGQTHRELMVSIRYPARAGAGRYPPAPQLSAREAAAFDARNNFSEQVPPGKVQWAATRTSAHAGAPLAAGRPSRRWLPVVLYSPGVVDPRSFGSTLCDELASRGYAVVTIDHTYEAPAVEFPDGRLARSVLATELAKAQKSGRITELLKKVSGVRVADVRFVLDELAERGAASPVPAGLRRALDLRAVGMFGQSAGGFTAAQTLHDDRRIKAAVNLDGVMGYTQRDDDPANPSTVGREGVDRPLLLMGMAGNTHHTVASWGAVWRHSTGTWLRDLTLRGSRHASYTDAEALVPQIARRVGLPRTAVTALIGTVDPARAVAAQRAYVSAFFDRWLRGRDDGGLLDRPSGRFPEVEFVR
ncbi:MULTISPECIES: hydrolase [unclassified Streptomyces]|uniref:alpha/beta hydrolase family protein n=1 Tax=unclassified Streptomyces TaxID=2593676 RepID=UPI002736313E|nr:MULTISPECIES: hydrolase [unclassified Streptomyces]